MADFKGYVTSVGQQFEALAKQMGYPVTIGFIEIGDGKLPDSESPINRTRLVNPLKQFPAIVEQDAKNPGQWVATCYIPADDAINGAGYMIREIGCKLINQGNGILYAYRRVSDDWKPADSSGEAKSFIYKLRFIPSNGELLTPTIDPSVVLVSKEELARVMKAHEDSRNHPDATELAKGFTQYANLQKALAGEDNLAVTPKVMKAVLSALGLTKYGAPMIGVPIDWPLAQMPQDIFTDCGMVFLSSAGQIFNKTTYPLAAMLYPSGVMPEIRAEFVRAWDNGRGVDAGRTLLSAQMDAFQNFTGTIHSRPDAAAAGAITSASGAFSYSAKTGSAGASAISTSASATNLDVTSLDPSRVARTANETRPRSIAFHKIMRVA